MRVSIMPSCMPDARTRPSSSFSSISRTSGDTSILKLWAFSSRKGMMSRLRESMVSTEKSSFSSTATICRMEMLFHRSSAASKSSWATSAAFSAPMDVPYTPSRRMFSSRSACHAPHSYAPLDPPPESTSARFISIPPYPIGFSLQL